MEHVDIKWLKTTKLMTLLPDPFWGLLLCIWHCFPRGQEWKVTDFSVGLEVKADSKTYLSWRQASYNGKTGYSLRKKWYSWIFVHLTNQMVDVYCVWFQGGVFLLDVWPPCLILVGQKVHSSSIPKVQFIWSESDRKVMKLLGSTIGIIHI